MPSKCGPSRRSLRLLRRVDIVHRSSLLQGSQASSFMTDALVDDGEYEVFQLLNSLSTPILIIFNPWRLWLSHVPGGGGGFSASVRAGSPRGTLRSTEQKTAYGSLVGLPLRFFLSSGGRYEFVPPPETRRISSPGKGRLIRPRTGMSETKDRRRFGLYLSDSRVRPGAFRLRNSMVVSLSASNWADRQSGSSLPRKGRRY